jgi:mRNA interferase RelE/StbE
VAWTLQWSARALKDLARLDRSIRERIVTAVERLADTGEGDVRRLHGRDRDVFRLRVGEWRVLFTILDGLVVLIARVHPRGSAYRP